MAYKQRLDSIKGFIKQKMGQFIIKVQKINHRVSQRKGINECPDEESGSIGSADGRLIDDKTINYLQIPYTLIITDCNMPVMDGFEMGCEIKKCYAEFINSFVKVKSTQIVGVNR